MNISRNMVLVTGGSAGIGFEIARQFVSNGNHVIITGRNEERLQQAAARLGNATAIVSDVSVEADVEKLVEAIQAKFPSLNIVVNNAGSAFLYNLSEDTGIFSKASEEMLTNYLSVIRLNEKLLPLLKNQREAAIVNVSSIVAFVPGSLATYSASKAALHSYTQSLRMALATSTVKVFELMPPLVDTQFSAPIGGHNGIPASDVALELINALATDNFEIHVGQTENLYQLFLSSPEKALEFMWQRRQAAENAS